ncbi:hypothetical protein G9A89_001858 [Geosiphon pyriformis]|nr:hypothetical protein G9A89_001858 [Geosiphon pyriformis]
MFYKNWVFPSLSYAVSNAFTLGSSSSKILTAKMEGLDFGEVRSVVCWLSLSDVFFIPMNDLVWKIAMCNVCSINVPAKQDDIVYWHMNSDNMISIITETKLKPGIKLWIINKFNGVRIFSSGVDKSFFGARVAIIMSNSLACYVSKIEEVSGRIISVRLLFKGKLSVMILGLYASVSAEMRYSQTSEINFFIAKAVNSSTFVVVGENLNKNSTKRSISFKFYLDLDLKVIDFIFVAHNLASAVANHKVRMVSEFFDTDYKAVSITIGLVVFWMYILTVCTSRQTEIDGNSESKMLVMKVGHDLEAVFWAYFWKGWRLSMVLKILKEMIVVSANKMFSKLWFSGSDASISKHSLKFFRLKLLVAKLVKSISSGQVLKTACLITIWAAIDKKEAIKVYSMVENDICTSVVLCHLSCVKKSYHKSKYCEFQATKDEFIRKTINKCMENFCSDKGKMIRSVLDCHCLVSSSTSVCWLNQYTPLDYTDDVAFLSVMDNISFDEFLQVVKFLPDRKTAGLSGIPNELWKHGNQQVLDELLNILNKCLRSDTNNLVRIKMCSRFIKFFESIHNNCINQVITDFGLTNGYIVKRHESLFEYCLNLKFFIRTGRQDHKSALMLYLAAEAFVDNTIWIENSMAAAQHILNIASNFFYFNDILINVKKTVTISINHRVEIPYLIISGSAILIAKKDKAHCYLGIYLSIDGLSKPSLAKAQSDIKFFVNLVLRKVVFNKQFLYLVFAVLQPIVRYRLQFSHASDRLLRKSLKLKTNLPRDFFNEAISHPKLYSLKIFRQLQAENSLANLIIQTQDNGFVSHQLDAPAIPQFSVGITNTLALCKLSLGNILPNVFCAGSDFIGNSGLVGSHVPASDPALGGCLVSLSSISKHLLENSGNVVVYTDGSIKGLGSIGIRSSAAAYFPDIDNGVKVRMSGLLLSALIKLHTIAFALECIQISSSVTLFINSQTSLDAYNFYKNFSGLDFHDKCWIERDWICQNIASKNLLVAWNKIKSHSGVYGNEHADLLANAVTIFVIVLSVETSCRFLSIEEKPVSRNAHHFVRHLFDAVSFVG